MARRPLPIPIPPQSKADQRAARLFQIEEIKIRTAELRREIDERVQRRVEINEAAKAKIRAHRIKIHRRAKQKLAELSARFGKDR